MKRSKFIHSVILTLAMFFFPLIGRLELLLTPHIIFFMAGSIWSLMTQPAIDWKDVLRRKKQDNFTTLWIMGVIVFSQTVSIVEWAYFSDRDSFHLNEATVLGVGCIVFGGGLRYWAIRTLGKFFTASVAVVSSQKIIDRGPYRYLRHPSYTGGVLTVAGTPLVLQNTYTLYLTLILILIVYAFRIRAEEKLMIKTFGEHYRSYQKHTWQLIPYIW